MKEKKHHITPNKKIISSYSLVIKPLGRPRGKASLVAYKQKNDENDHTKINRKRNFKQVSPDAKRFISYLSLNNFLQLLGYT